MSSLSAPRPSMKRSFSFAKRQAQYRRPICPFISSTFQDFQAERDILIKKVFPALNAICKQRGSYCTPIDLRWGINNSQVNSGLVIQLCLDYVKRCAPYFICLLGERYGSCRPSSAPKLPKSHDQLAEDADWLDRNFVVAGSAGYEWVLQDQYQDRSVTELEIIQAAFLEDGEFCRFYFRQPDHTDDLFADLPEDIRTEKLQIFESESEYSNLKVRNLKARIVKKGLDVEYFRTPEELGRKVFDNWKQIVNKLYPPLLDVITSADQDRFQEWTAHETYAETRRTVFVKSPELEDLFDHMTDFALSSMTEDYPDLDDPTPPENQSSSIAAALLRRKKPPVAHYQSILQLVGDRGSGKTSCMANWVKEFAEDYPEVTLFVHYVGSSAASLDAGKMMRRAMGELRPNYRAQAGEPDELEGASSEGMAAFRNICEAFLAAVRQEQPCVLVLDGIDELTGACGLSAQQIKELDWLPFPLPPQAKFIVSTLKSDITYRHLAKRGDVKTLPVPILRDQDQKKTIIQDLLAIHCKCLNREQLEKIVSCKLSDKPIFLSILANELRVFGVYSRLDCLLDGYLEAMSVRDLWGRIIKRWVGEYGWTTEQESSENAGNNSDNSHELTGWVADALRLIAVSRNGLSTAEIRALLPSLGYTGDAEVTSIDWAVFRCAALDSLFERPGGLLTFFHKHFKEAVEHTLLGAVTPDSSTPIQELQYIREGLDKRSFHKHLADYFYALPYSSRRINELPWQLERAGDYDRLCTVLTDPVIFLKMFGDKFTLTPLKTDLLHYWQTLTDQGYDPSAVYWKTYQLASGETLDEDTDDVQIENLENEKQASMVSALNALPSDIKDENSNSTSIPRIESDLSVSTLADSGVQGTEEEYMALLGNQIGFFLCAFAYFKMGEKVLLETYHRLNQSFPLDVNKQKLFCETHESIGNMYFYLMRREEAELWYDKGLQVTEELLKEIDDMDEKYVLTEMKGRLLDHLGTMKAYAGRFYEAERMLHKARKCMDYVGTVTGTAQIHFHIGILRSQQGDFARAEAQFKKSLKTFETWFGRSHPRVADVLEGLAGVLSNQGYQGYDRKEAEKLFRRSLKIRESLMGEKHLLVATSLCNLGALLRTEAKTALKMEAVGYLRRALDIRTTKLGPNHQLTKDVHTNLSHLEIVVKYKPSRPLDTRTTELPVSNLSWRSRDLALIKQRATDKVKVNGHGSRSHTPREGSAGSSVRNVSLIIVRKPKQKDRGVRDHDEGYIENTTDILSETRSRSFGATQGSCESSSVWSDIDQEELMNEESMDNSRNEDLNESIPLQDTDENFQRPISGDPVTRVHIRKAEGPNNSQKSVSILDRKDPPVTMLQKYFAVHKSSSTASAPVSPVLDLSRQHVPTRPHSTMTVHRQRCHTPRAHEITKRNAKSAIMSGPHCSLTSLLGAKPCPRRPSQIHHSSAWYHIPGRYATVDQPCPPKRSQSRINSTLVFTSPGGSSAGSSRRSSGSSMGLNRVMQVQGAGYRGQTVHTGTRTTQLY